MYYGSFQQISFEIRLISKRTWSGRTRPVVIFEKKIVDCFSQ